MAERLSLTDDTLISSYTDHIQRYQFALQFCTGKRVLDAGCGIGYGSRFLAANGAAFVTGLDLSGEAISEAKRLFKRPNLSFHQGNVEELDKFPDKFDTVVNFENLEHIGSPQKLINGVRSIVDTGVFITSTPNGALTQTDERGNPRNPFHVKEYAIEELQDLLKPAFSTVSLYGQWLTHGGKLRKLRARQLFDQLTETYYNPMNRIGRVIKGALGKTHQPPPAYDGEADSFDGDYVIKPIGSDDFPWEPATLIAVCEKQA